jgi:hypothetical protein
MKHMRHSILVECEDEQNRGFKKLDREGDQAERFQLHIDKPRFRLGRELTRGEIELLLN